jgi:hypothetical protein
MLGSWAEQWWPHQAGDGLSLTTGTGRPCGGWCPSNETWGLAGHLHLRCWGRVPWDGGFANLKTEPFFYCTKYSFALRSTSFFYDTIAVCGLLYVHPIASRFQRFPRYTRGFFAHFDFQVQSPSPPSKAKISSSLSLNHPNANSGLPCKPPGPVPCHDLPAGIQQLFKYTRTTSLPISVCAGRRELKTTGTTQGVIGTPRKDAGLRRLVLVQRLRRR